jgi:hypothetical protein
MSGSVENRSASAIRSSRERGRRVPDRAIARSNDSSASAGAPVLTWDIASDRSAVIMCELLLSRSASRTMPPAVSSARSCSPRMYSATHTA